LSSDSTVGGGDAGGGTGTEEGDWSSTATGDDVVVVEGPPTTGASVAESRPSGDDTGAPVGEVNTLSGVGGGVEGIVDGMTGDEVTCTEGAIVGDDAWACRTLTFAVKAQAVPDEPKS